MNDMLLSEPRGLIDSHCHLDYISDISAEDVCSLSTAVGVNKMIVPGVAPAQWQQIIDLRARGLPIACAVGVHPWWLHTANPQTLGEELSSAVARFQPVAIGECGLDKRLETDMGYQIEMLAIQLQVAKSALLPVILHSVHMHAELLKHLKSADLSMGGVVHAFNGSYEQAKAFWQQGYYLGVGGTITYERANKTRETIKRMPLESLLLETDAPDMPIQGKQGQQNLPQYLPEIAQALADLKNIPLEDVINQTRANTERLFNLSC